MEKVIILMLIFSTPLVFILTQFYLKLQEIKMQSGGGDTNETRKDLGNLMAENEELKDRVKNLEYIITDEKKRIDLDYEKEQILIDKKNKFEY
jgi:cell division protein FtsB